MGVYIDMEMPTNCGDCPCARIFDGYTCMATKRSFDIYPLENREDWCPLVEVPESHGRLIDASEKIGVQMYDDMTEDYYIAEMTIDDLLSHKGWVEADAPTVIPANKEE